MNLGELTIKRVQEGLLKKEFSVDLDIKDINLSGGTIFLRCSSLLKSEILLRRDKILSALGPPFREIV